jgi:hypothetical protein
MSTTIELADGRVLAVSNGAFDAILEHAARHLDSGRVPGLSQWLLEQRCIVQGPGIGYLDVRELSPAAAAEFRAACMASHEATANEVDGSGWWSHLTLLIRMWESIDRNEPPEALTSPYWLMTPPSGARKGPGWPEAA